MTPAPGAGDYPDLLRLDGLVHVVVGVGPGIGRETARALAAAGARVVCVDVDEAQAVAVAAETGGVAAVCDITEPDGFARVLSDAERRLGRIDGVTDVVGLVRWKPLSDTADDDWGWQSDVVAAQAVRVLRTAVPHLRRAGGGTLTFIASVSAFTSAPGHGLYGMAKAALLSMVRTAAVELGPEGIRVNAVSPGATLTPRLAADPRFAEAIRANGERTPLRRIALPSDIACAVLFLSSRLAGHVTGHDLVVDGGLTNTWPLASPDHAAF
ncbi:SDR family oxidoreductase [Microtetraspora sp. AC03309]|uniref:SDR family NAD(P)-dependent oxidoreductase n=1 Tax=Microtetraspora sp. AC03309 TaxID=2779376 RepID=UPI001E3554FA|nr:SDR family oxidoreductase [Microtetraspora sp. AC03309]MCC5577489.1 SDR family oxidoreductase [Microtetraspora sp. AC03309]